MLARRSRKGTPHALLVGMSTDVVTVENTMKVLQKKLHIELSHDPANSTSDKIIYPRELKIRSISFWAQQSCENINWQFSNFYPNFLYQSWIYNVWLDALSIIASNTCSVPAKAVHSVLLSVWYPEQLNPRFRQV